MDRITVNAQPREPFKKGRARKIRSRGEIPAILYGLGQEGVPLTINAKEFNDALEKSSGGLNVLVDLHLQGQDKVAVMIKDYQADVIRRHFLHVDFLKIDLSKKITVEVPITLVGKAPGVKEGGILEHITRTVRVACLPIAIPNQIEADVSSLQIGNNLHISDLKLPEGVEVLDSPDKTITAVVAPIAEEEVAPSTEVVQPEVLTEKKPAEEGKADEKEKEKK